MTTAGQTLGVEEEYVLVDAVTGALADAPEVVPAAQALLGGDAQPEISTSQLEVVTPVCTSLAEVRAQLVRLRSGAVAAAAASGCRILACGTHPSASWREQRLTDGERYRDLVRRWGLLARQQVITGCHVHVGVPDPDLVVPVLDRLRPDLPVLLAMTGGSPFWEGDDTGYASYRTQWFGRWPVTGTPPVLGTRAAYDALVASLVDAELVGDASHLYWDVRPSTRYPTVEVRVADTCPLLDDAVLHAALVRSLVRVAATEAAAQVPAAQPHPDLVRAARWRAAREGLEGRLLDLRTGRLVPAADLLADLLRRLREDLEQAGEWDEVAALVAGLRARGTSARRQREVAATAGGDLRAVVRAVAAESERGLPVAQETRR